MSVMAMILICSRATQFISQAYLLKETYRSSLRMWRKGQSCCCGFSLMGRQYFVFHFCEFVWVLSSLSWSLLVLLNISEFILVFASCSQNIDVTSRYSEWTLSCSGRLGRVFAIMARRIIIKFWMYCYEMARWHLNAYWSVRSLTPVKCLEKFFEIREAN